MEESNGPVVRNYIAGDWQSSTSDMGKPVFNPATSEQLAYVPFATAEEVNTAVQAGRVGFEQWRNRPVEERIQPLFRLKTLLEEHQESLAELLVRDHGKTLAEARGEIRRGIENVEVACGAPSMLQAGSLENAAPEIDETAIRQPLGVFTAISPFNFPAMIPLWFLPYAVASGNAFILKPSEQDPLVPERLFELIDEAGFPPGVVQLLHGGPDVVNELLAHDGVTGVSFVGSTPVAEHVYETAAEHGKRVQAQGGAKNHVIVAKSADLDFAADQVLSSSLACAGERCLANDVILVASDLYDEFTNRLVTKARRMTVGYGLDEPDMAALVTGDHEARVREYIQTAIDEGANMLLDGREITVEGYEAGHFLGPTIFGNVSAEMTISTEEVFGPVVAVAPFDSFEGAIERVNRSEFGNAASLFTERGREARRFRNAVEAGNLAVNAGTAAPMAFFHFGGRKASFFGDLHAQGEDMFQFYTDKTIYIERWPDKGT